jgi:hypothetical protein
MDLRRPHLTLRDFFLYEQRMVAEAQIHKFFSKLIWSLIVLNVLIGIPTIYDKFFYEQTPEILRDISTIQTNEV